MSNTPETDAAEFDGIDGQGGMIVISDFARKLERERDEWQKKFYETHRQRDILLNALNRISESLAFAKKHAGKRIE